MEIKMNNQLGLTDIPATDDLFEIGSYIDGLVGFIKECRTPMTISIQGTWGTGKTSVMRMVKHRIDPASELDDNTDTGADCKCVYFNTWEFSQFNLSNNIALVMLQQLTNVLAGDDMSLADTFVGTFGKVFEVALKIGAGRLAGGADTNIIDAFKKGDLDLLKDLKNEFQLLINKKLGLKNPKENCALLDSTDSNKRVVFFIDDLDRLDPEKAVEILEVLKNFLDCKNCVFILAIDYDVVCRGVAGKYHFDLNDSKNSRKGKDFFDKIIQVPFKMPVEQYNITAYIRELLGSVSINGTPLMDAKDNYGRYEDFVRASIGTNPRAIKRLVNSYQLISMVVSYNREIDLKESKLLLFATLCLQELDVDIYRAIARRKDSLKSEDLICFREGDVETIKRIYETLNIDEFDLERIGVFMSLLIDILDTEKGNDLNDDELKPFSQILKIAGVTGNDSTMEIKKGTAALRSNISELVKIVNRDAVEHIAMIIEEETGIKPVFKDRPNDVSITAKFDIAEKLSVTFFEAAKGDGFTLWCEAKTTFFENIPEALQNVLNRKNEKRNKPITPHYTSANSTKMYFSFTMKNGNMDDERDIREILRACKEAS